MVVWREVLWQLVPAGFPNSRLEVALSAVPTLVVAEPCGSVCSQWRSLAVEAGRRENAPS